MIRLSVSHVNMVVVVLVANGELWRADSYPLLSFVRYAALRRTSVSLVSLGFSASETLALR